MFKPIKDFENEYAINDEGIIFSIRNNAILKQTIGPSGYATVVLCKKGFRRTKRVNRLVAETFIPNPENKSSVNHLDGNKLNNNMSNLEWSTPLENIEHAYALGLIKNQGVTASNSKFTQEHIDMIRERINNGESCLELANELGVNKSTISRIYSKRTYQ